MTAADASQRQKMMVKVSCLWQRKDSPIHHFRPTLNTMLSQFVDTVPSPRLYGSTNHSHFKRFVLFFLKN
jgi:hypothetical protein